MTYNINAHEVRAQAFLQAFKDVIALTKQSVAMIKSQLQGSSEIGHTA